MYQESWGDRFDQVAVVDDWIWTGFLRAGQITLLTAPGKTGKTTLLSHWLASRQTGAAFLGAPVQTGRTVVVTEETQSQWAQRCQALGFGREVCFIYQPFAVRPTMGQFEELITFLLDIKTRRQIDTVIFDTMSRLLPVRCENSAELMQEGLAPLGRLTGEKIATVICHHPAKGQTTLGLAARGSGALSAFVDITLELHRYAPKVAGDRRRVLVGCGRDAATPAALTIELSEDGTALTVVPQEGAETLEFWDDLRIALEDAPHPLTRRELRARWPESLPRPVRRTLWTWLQRARKAHLVAWDGTGHRNSPHRYWLPCKMAEWLADPLWRAMHHVADPADVVSVPTATAAEAVPAQPPPVETMSVETTSVETTSATPPLVKTTAIETTAVQPTATAAAVASAAVASATPTSGCPDDAKSVAEAKDAAHRAHVEAIRAAMLRAGRV